MSKTTEYTVKITTDTGDIAELRSACPVLLLGSHENVYRALASALSDLRADMDLPPSTSDPSPSDIGYDDMTRAWRNGDYPLTWSLADALLQYLANDGQPLTGGRSLFYVRQIYVYYAPLPG